MIGCIKIASKTSCNIKQRSKENEEVQVSDPDMGEIDFN